MRHTAMAAALMITILGLAGCSAADPGGETSTTEPPSAEPTASTEASPEPSGEGESELSPETGPGTPEVTVTVDGTPVTLTPEEIECRRGATTASFTNPDPQGNEHGLVMNLVSNPPGHQTFTYSSGDILIAPPSGEYEDALTVTLADDVWTVSGTLPNHYGNGRLDVKLEIVAACRVCGAGLLRHRLPELCAIMTTRRGDG